MKTIAGKVLAGLYLLNKGHFNYSEIYDLIQKTTSSFLVAQNIDRILEVLLESNVLTMGKDDCCFNIPMFKTLSINEAGFVSKFFETHLNSNSSAVFKVNSSLYKKYLQITKSLMKELSLNKKVTSYKGFHSKEDFFKLTNNDQLEDIFRYSLSLGVIFNLWNIRKIYSNKRDSGGWNVPFPKKIYNKFDFSIKLTEFGELVLKQIYD